MILSVSVIISLYRIVDPGHGAPVIATEIDHAGYKESMNNLRRIMPIVGFTNQVRQMLCYDELYYGEVLFFPAVLPTVFMLSLLLRHH